MQTQDLSLWILGEKLAAQRGLDKFGWDLYEDSIHLEFVGPKLDFNGLD